MREDDDRQGSLFGGEAFSPPARARPAPARPQEAVAPPEVQPPEAAPRQGHSAPPDEVAAPPESSVAPPESIAAPPESSVAPPESLAAPPEGLIAPPSREFVVPDEEAEEFRVSRAAGTPLAGPTLDDAVSRAWEGLVAGVPTACPVCHGELAPGLGGGLHGYCGSCHVTLD
jgi:hypothetical protein